MLYGSIKIEKRYQKNLNQLVPLYRGISFEYFSELVDILKGEEEFEFSTIASWTREKKIAKTFAGDRLSFGIVLKKKFIKEDVIIDFFAFCESDLLKEIQSKIHNVPRLSSEVLELCHNEKEVLVKSPPNTKVSLDDIVGVYDKKKKVAPSKFISDYEE